MHTSKPNKPSGQRAVLWTCKFLTLVITSSKSVEVLRSPSSEHSKSLYFYYDYFIRFGCRLWVVRIEITVKRHCRQSALSVSREGGRKLNLSRTLYDASCLLYISFF